MPVLTGQHASVAGACVPCNDCLAGVRARVSEYRRRMRERGYRPIQVWVPDVWAEGCSAEAHRQAAAVAAAERDWDDQAFIEAVSAPWDGE